MKYLILFLIAQTAFGDTVISSTHTYETPAGTLTVERHVIIQESRREVLTPREIKIIEHIYKMIEMMDEDIAKIKIIPGERIHTADELWPRRRVPKNYQPETVGLNPSGLNGNPSFVINTHVNHSDGVGISSCQATQVAQQGDVCILATAAHCVDDDSGETQKMMTIDTANYGRVQAMTIMNPNYLAYKARNKIAQDTAVIVIKGQACLEAKVATVPLHRERLEDGEHVALASRWHPGIYEGVKVDDIGRSISKVVSTSQYFPGVKQGDSGGAVLAKGRNGQLELAGVLSHGDMREEYCTDPNYSTNSAMQWLSAQTDSVLNQLKPRDTMVSMQ
jgi:hypothetical protein